MTPTLSEEEAEFLASLANLSVEDRAAFLRLMKRITPTEVDAHTAALYKIVPDEAP